MLGLCLVVGDAAVRGGETLEVVKARGEVRCGVSEGIPGFSVQDASGRWTGLEVDFCRAVAAALFGDPGRAAFVPLKASARFPALQARKIDMLVQQTAWTMTREAVLKVRFPAVLFYDRQSIMVPASSSVQTLADLNGATIAVEKGTLEEEHLLEFFRARGLSVQPLVIDSAVGVVEALAGGRCGACSSTGSQLAAMRVGAPGGPEAFRMLPDEVYWYPLGPAVLGGDAEWETFVRWVLFALILVEERGINRDNVEAVARSKENTTWDRLTGRDALFARAIGVQGDWAVRAVKAVGNYGEMYDRNVGCGSPLKIERGPNRNWKDGGLMYAPPID